MVVKNRKSAGNPIPTANQIPDREVGQFNSTGDTGIVVDLEMQFGSELKDADLMQEFITRFKQATRDKQSIPES